ncbi:amidohydrolase family protein [Kribbella speibonae]|uniref:Amidohydrolase n=1 Tax=Kribbella speibonae TaxID=1572660 RepID=A0ABY2A4K5_9ACTN|nr:amidohydrolase family protein [Kribbella speibonae]TCC21802.1 amidohydrolase [Kribbella speibonae]
MIDAHVHVWDLMRRRLPWLPAGHPLRRDFTLSDLPDLPELVLVQADADPGEVGDLLALARQNPAVVGVVGWFDLLDFPDRLPDDPRMVGVRSPPADQTDPDLLTAPAHVRGVRAAADAGLAIDLLLRPSALIGAARLASAVPDARLVLDHLGNPTTVTPEWRSGMQALAEHPNATVKLSGTAHLATDDLRALVDVALELFGSERLLFGSDWPVCTLAATRAEVIRRTTALLPPATHNDVFRGTAQRIYRPRETAQCPNTPAGRS